MKQGHRCARSALGQFASWPNKVLRPLKAASHRKRQPAVGERPPRATATEFIIRQLPSFARGFSVSTYARISSHVQSHRNAQNRTTFAFDSALQIDYWRNGDVELRPQLGRALFCFDRFSGFGECACPSINGARSRVARLRNEKMSEIGVSCCRTKRRAHARH